MRVIRDPATVLTLLVCLGAAASGFIIYALAGMAAGQFEPERIVLGGIWQSLAYFVMGFFTCFRPGSFRAGVGQLLGVTVIVVAGLMVLYHVLELRPAHRLEREQAFLIELSLPFLQCFAYGPVLVLSYALAGPEAPDDDFSSIDQVPFDGDAYKAFRRANDA